MNLTLVWNVFVWPLTGPLLVYLALPFFVARTCSLLLMGPSEDDLEAAFTAHHLEGLCHVIFLAGLMGVFLMLASMGYFKELHDQIRDELYVQIKDKFIHY